MKPRDEFVSRDDGFSLGVDEETGTPYLSIPVSSGVADYEEFYRLDPEEHSSLLADPRRALPLVDEARGRRLDDRLLQQPGWNRGTPVLPAPAPLLSVDEARRILLRHLRRHSLPGRGEIVIGEIWRADDDYFFPRVQVRDPFAARGGPPPLDNGILLIDRRTGEVVTAAFTGNVDRIRSMRTVAVPASVVARNDGIAAILRERIVRESEMLDALNLWFGEAEEEPDIVCGDAETRWCARWQDGVFDIVREGRTPDRLVQTSSARMAAMSLATWALSAFAERGLVPVELWALPAGAQLSRCDGRLELSWGRDRARFPPESDISTALKLVHLTLADQGELLSSLADPEGRPLLQPVEESLAELRVIGGDPRMYSSFARWQEWTSRR